MKKIVNYILALTVTSVFLTACSASNNSQQLPLYTQTGTVSAAAQQAGADTANDSSAAVQQEAADTGNSSSAAASADTAQSNEKQASSASEKVFTKDELSRYDGKNGNPAYVAVDGVVYDVTNVPQWRNGQHNGRYNAGMDLTEVFKTKSPHDSGIFNGIPVVGKYAG